MWGAEVEDLKRNVAGCARVAEGDHVMCAVLSGNRMGGFRTHNPLSGLSGLRKTARGCV